MQTNLCSEISEIGVVFAGSSAEPSLRASVVYVVLILQRCDIHVSTQRYMDSRITFGICQKCARVVDLSMSAVFGKGDLD